MPYKLTCNAVQCKKKKKKKNHKINTNKIIIIFSNYLINRCWKNDICFKICKIILLK